MDEKEGFRGSFDGRGAGIGARRRDSRDPCGGGIVQSVSAADNVSYIDADGVSRTVNGVSEIASDSTSWNAGWYVVTGTVEIGQRVSVTGDVHLILADGCNLTVNHGIGLNGETSNITIYGQTANTGGLTSTVSSDCAGIGGNFNSNCGSISIYGGQITAESNNDGAGIGSGYMGSCGDIQISGNAVIENVQGGDSGAGIGSAYIGSCEDIQISGNAEIRNVQGGDEGAGIGSGYIGSCGNIQISGNAVIENVQGNDGGAGIGSGYHGSCGDIQIGGNAVIEKAQGSSGAGIGSGWSGNCGSITINGGTVTASSTIDGAGIGSGYSGSCGLITISGGTVHAFSGTYGDCNAIGNGSGDTGTFFSTGEDGDAVIYATATNGEAIAGMTNGQLSPEWSGIFFLGSGTESTEGIVSGNVSLAGDYTVEIEQTLTVPEGATLIIPEGVTLTVNGEIQNNGSIICYGTIVNPENIEGEAVVYPQPEPEPTPEPEEEEEIYIPSEPIPDGIHEYSLGTMLYIDGKRVKGLYAYNGAVYYFDNRGFMQTGWVETGDGWRYFAADGRMMTGWLKLGNVWYYLDPETGLMYADGLYTIGKSAYYFYDWGGMANDWWYEAADGWYFFGGSGAMKTAQWTQWKGEWYYLTETGRMAADTTVGGYYVNASGVWVQ